MEPTHSLHNGKRRSRRCKGASEKNGPQNGQSSKVPPGAWPDSDTLAAKTNGSDAATEPLDADVNYPAWTLFFTLVVFIIDELHPASYILQRYAWSPLPVVAYSFYFAQAISHAAAAAGRAFPSRLDPYGERRGAMDLLGDLAYQLALNVGDELPYHLLRLDVVAFLAWCLGGEDRFVFHVALWMVGMLVWDDFVERAGNCLLLSGSGDENPEERREAARRTAEWVGQTSRRESSSGEESG